MQKCGVLGNWIGGMSACRQRSTGSGDHTSCVVSMLSSYAQVAMVAVYMLRSGFGQWVQAMESPSNKIKSWEGIGSGAIEPIRAYTNQASQWVQARKAYLVLLGITSPQGVARDPEFKQGSSRAVCSDMPRSLDKGTGVPGRETR